MPEDDDTNYTVTALAIFDKYGPGFAPDDVGRFWLDNIPLTHTCTAERVAYRNLVDLVTPPVTATRRNPAREWIGAQIRADFWGYVAAGRPERAAEYAWRDAALSHVKNGIYGEMFMAACIAAARVLDCPEAIVRAGLSEIPAECRLAEDVQQVLAWHSAETPWEAMVEKIHARWDETFSHHWCHTNSNAMICVAALVTSGDDFAKAICRAVQPAFDTDCNGATVGSIVGMMLGAKRLPATWIDPLNDRLDTGVAGYHRVSIEGMAEKTLELTKRES